METKIKQQRIEVKKWENILKTRATRETWSIFYREREKLIKLLEMLE